MNSIACLAYIGGFLPSDDFKYKINEFNLKIGFRDKLQKER